MNNVVSLHVDTRVVDLHRAAVKAMCEHRLIDAVRLELDALELDPSFEEAETVIAWALKNRFWKSLGIRLRVVRLGEKHGPKSNDGI